VQSRCLPALLEKAFNPGRIARIVAPADAFHLPGTEGS
jgi:hypothetical protein